MHQDSLKHELSMVGNQAGEGEVAMIMLPGVLGTIGGFGLIELVAGLCFESESGVNDYSLSW